MPPSTARVRAIAEMLGPYASQLKGRRIAIIAGDPTTYGMSRMFDNLLEAKGVTVAVFEIAADAEAWLRGELPP
ncbi:MAG TPA: hypothetical protein VN032_08605 [Thermoanaerobaculia bacterium]|jgi:hypothetical protein|nr:hypothetical protein [Thermoanaerobaculia bacterium]